MEIKSIYYFIAYYLKFRYFNINIFDISNISFEYAICLHIIAKKQKKIAKVIISKNLN